MATLVTGIFKTRSHAQRAVEALVDNGYARDDISLLMSDATRGREFAIKMVSRAPEGAAAGATIGGVLGAVAAGLVSLGILVVPGVALVAVGPVVAALAGLGAGAAAGAARKIGRSPSNPGTGPEEDRRARSECPRPQRASGHCSTERCS